MVVGKSSIIFFTPKSNFLAENTQKKPKKSICDPKLVKY